MARSLFLLNVVCIIIHDFIRKRTMSGWRVKRMQLCCSKACARVCESWHFGPKSPELHYVSNIYCTCSACLTLWQHLIIVLYNAGIHGIRCSASIRLRHATYLEGRYKLAFHLSVRRWYKQVLASAFTFTYAIPLNDMTTWIVCEEGVDDSWALLSSNAESRCLKYESCIAPSLWTQKSSSTEYAPTTCW
jgi:hypothetical protein